MIGREEWITDPDYATPEARLPRLKDISATIEEWTKTKTKFEAMAILNEYDIPCGPILSMKELAEEPSLRQNGTVVEIDHPTRGKYLTVRNPIKLSDSPTEVARSPLLGEHTDEILSEVLGFDESRVRDLKNSGALGGSFYFKKTHVIDPTKRISAGRAVLLATAWSDRRRAGRRLEPGSGSGWQPR